MSADLGQSVQALSHHEQALIAPSARNRALPAAVDLWPRFELPEGAQELRTCLMIATPLSNDRRSTRPEDLGTPRRSRCLLSALRSTLRSLTARPPAGSPRRNRRLTSPGFAAGCTEGCSWFGASSGLAPIQRCHGFGMARPRRANLCRGRAGAAALAGGVGDMLVFSSLRAPLLSSECRAGLSTEVGPPQRGRQRERS
jgi:hypothetical protein